MKYLFIAIYLAHGTDIPTVQTEKVSDLLTCKKVQTMWMKKSTTGSKWGICTKLNMRTI